LKNIKQKKLIQIDLIKLINKKKYIYTILYMDKIISIFFLIISYIYIYIFTNCVKTTNQNTNNIFHDFIYHEPGSVCPLGQMFGKYFIIFTIILIFFIFTNTYKNKIIYFHSIILFIIIILWFIMNPSAAFKLLPAFITHIIIIYYYLDKSAKKIL